MLNIFLNVCAALKLCDRHAHRGPIAPGQDPGFDQQHAETLCMWNDRSTYWPHKVSMVVAEQCCVCVCVCDIRFETKINQIPLFTYC